MRFPLDLSIFDAYIRTEDPVDYDKYMITVSKSSTPAISTFSIQATLKQVAPPVDGSMPQLEIVFQQHELGDKHGEPHLQIKIHGPCGGDRIHLGTYYLMLEVASQEEAENIVKGYICLARDMLHKIGDDLPGMIFNLELIKGDMLDAHVPLVQRKINELSVVYLKPSAVHPIRLPGPKSLRPDTDGYVHLTLPQFKELFTKSEEERIMQPLLILVQKRQ